MKPFIAEEIQRYADEHSSPEPALFAELAAETRASTKSPQMMVGHSQAQLLRFIVRMLGAKRVLEIGTFTGYSAMAISEALPADGELVTCDVDPRSTAIARRFWSRHPAGSRIRLRLAPALETIASIEQPLDFVFIDADKANYVRYWDAVIPRMRGGGVVAADNVLWSGEVLDPQTADALALAAFNEHLLRDPRVDVVMLPIRDGLTLAQVR